MFFISKDVADGIMALLDRAQAARELAAIRAMPGFEIYVNAIAEGIDDRKGLDDSPQQPEDLEKTP